MGTGERRDWRLGLLTLGTWGLLLVLHLGFLEHHSLRNKEFITLRVVAQDCGEIVEERLSKSHMPGYFLALKAWTRVAGDSDAAIRAPSAFFSILGLVALWLTARRMLPGDGALLALTLAGFNQVTFYMSTDARMYSMLAASVAWACYFLVRFAEEQRTRDLAGLALASLVGLSSQLLFLLATVIMIGWAARTRVLAGKGRRGVLLALALPTLVLSPLIVGWSQRQGQVGVRGPLRGFEIDRALSTLSEIMLGDPDSFTLFDLKLLGVPLLVLGLWQLFLSHRSSDTQGGATGERGTAFMALFAALCVGTTVAIALGGIRAPQRIVLQWRYYVLAWSAAPLLLAAAWVCLRQARPRLLAAGWAGGVAILVFLNTATFVGGPDLGIRESIQYLDRHRAETEALLTDRPSNFEEAFARYGQATPAPRHLDEAAQGEALRDALEGVARGQSFWVIYYPNRSLQADRLWRLAHERESPLVQLGDIVTIGETRLARYRLKPERTGHVARPARGRAAAP